MLNQLENSYYNPNLVWINKIPRIFLYILFLYFIVQRNYRFSGKTMKRTAIDYRASQKQRPRDQHIECIDITENERIRTQGRPVSGNLCVK